MTMKRRHDPLLRTQPWKVMAVFSPIERILHRMETDGTIDTAGRYFVFREDGRGGWYDVIAALLGVIEFHQIATSRYGVPCDVAPLAKFATKLEAGVPLFIEDIHAVRQAIEQCKRQALGLRVSQACDIVDTVKISVAMDNVRQAGWPLHDQPDAAA